MTDNVLAERRGLMFGGGYMRAAVLVAVALGLTALMLSLVVFRAGASRFGDADCSGQVSSVDALFILQHTAGLLSIRPDCVDKADVNQDDSVNAIDAALVLQHVARLITLPTPFGTGDDVPTPGPFASR